MSVLKTAVALVVIMGLGVVMPLSVVFAQGAESAGKSGGAATPPDNQPGSNSSEKKEDVQGNTGEVPVYKPPMRGAPGRRVAGGTRGKGEALPAVWVLAPDDVGQTSQEQPSLYWFISGKAGCPIEFTLIETRATKPLAEVRLDQPPKPGLQCIRLADLGLRLKPGIEYQWFVALIPDPDQRSKDVVAGGVIERVDPPGEVRTRVAREGRKRAPFIYAEAGLWYDAISALSESAAADPGDAVSRRQRAALLQQVGLSDIPATE